MKKVSLFILNIFLCLNFFSQAPEAINYQAIVRDGTGAIIPNQSVGIQLSILQGSAAGATVYQETFSPTTNTFGLVTMQIGTGTTQTGSFSSIDWGLGPYFVETAVDVTGGTNYVVIATTQFMSVPYALHAKTVDTTFLNNAINTVSSDDQNISGSSLNGTDLTIGIENGNSETVDLSALQDGVDDADNDPTNELQALSLSGDTLYLTNGNNVYLGSLSNNLNIPSGGVLGNILTLCDNGPTWTPNGVCYQIGDTLQGGLVGYIYQNGDPGYIEGEIHGIIVTYNSYGTYPWGCSGSALTGLVTTLGQGLNNTIFILAQCTTPNTAADFCNNLNINGINDWVLPSWNDLQKIYANRNLIGISTFSNGKHMSSSQNAQNSSPQNQYYGIIFPTHIGGYNLNKVTPAYVRPIRYF